MKLDFSILHLLFFECLHVLACLSITTLTKLKRMHRLEIISENPLVIAIWLVLASIQCFSRFNERSIDCWFHMHLCWWSSVFKSLHIVYTDCHFIVIIISVRVHIIYIYIYIYIYICAENTTNSVGNHCHIYINIYIHIYIYIYIYIYFLLDQI